MTHEGETPQTGSGAADGRARRAALERLAAILDSVDEELMVFSPSLDLLHANAAAARRLGFEDVEELLREPGETLLARFEVVDGDGQPLPPVELPIRQALRGERAQRLVRYRAGDGERWASVSAGPVLDDGEIAFAVSIAHDVTEAKLAERRARAQAEAARVRLEFLARASELFARSLDFERTLDAIARLAVPDLAGYLVVDVVEEDGALRCVAAAHSDPEKTALVRSLRLGYPPVAPRHPVQEALRSGEPQLLVDLQAHVAEMAQDEQHAAAIREIANTSGIVVPLAARGRTLGTISLGTVAPGPPFDERDLELAVELARRASVALDNARLYGQAQARAHAADALEFVDDGVFLLDGDGVVRLWNPAAAATFGIRAGEAIGWPLNELVPEWGSLREQIPVAPEPSARRHRPLTLPVEAAGRECWLSISGVRFPGGTVFAFRDLTEQRAVDQLKTDFVSTVSHELRTPLAAIYGAALTLRRDDLQLEESQRDGLLDVIADESDRLARIVNDILWASRLDSGRMSFAIESCDAAATVRHVADAFAVHAPSRIALHLDAPEGLPPVAADPDKLRQVLTNLVDNAVKYSPDGGRVALGLSETSGSIRFHVSDEGIGVPPAERERIFEKFFRLDPNLTRGVGGTGLGLYIARELVQRMHGRIWVSSNGRIGSTFTVELPVAAASPGGTPARGEPTR